MPPAAARAADELLGPVNGRHVAYFARSDARAWSVLDGVSGPPYGQFHHGEACLQEPRLQADGSRQCLAARGDALRHVTHRPRD